MFEADGKSLAKLTLAQLKVLADMKGIPYLEKVKKDALIAALVGPEDGLMPDIERSLSGSSSLHEVDQPNGAEELTMGISGSENIGEEEQSQGTPVVESVETLVEPRIRSGEEDGLDAGMDPVAMKDELRCLRNQISELRSALTASTAVVAGLSHPSVHTQGDETGLGASTSPTSSSSSSSSSSSALSSQMLSQRSESTSLSRSPTRLVVRSSGSQNSGDI
jgi:hypothetical protein